MEFGMPTLIEHQNLCETAALCSKLGLKFIELNMNMPDYQIEGIENTDYLKSIANEYGLYFTIHLDENLNVCDFNNAVSEAYIETVKRTIAVAQKLNVPVLNMHMSEGVHFTLPNEKVYLFERYKDDYMTKITKFRDMCQKEAGTDSVKISIENTEGYRQFQKDAIEVMLSSSAFALTWDIGHSHACGNVDEGFIKSHFNRLMHFHIHDGLGKSNHLPLGTGEIDLNDRLGLASENNCRCVLEIKTANDLSSSVQWLKNYTNYL